MQLVLVRDEGDRLNTHFRAFPAPMGLALNGGRLAVGTRMQVWESVAVPAIAARLDPLGGLIGATRLASIDHSDQPTRRPGRSVFGRERDRR